MHTKRLLFSVAASAAFSFVFAGTASVLQAQQVSAAKPLFQIPVLLASSSNSAALPAESYSSSSSSSSAADDRLALNSSALDSAQPPPRRRYGRPNYSDSHNNPDGSSKFAFMAGGGIGIPVGNTRRYTTPNYSFQVGAGRNFSQSFGVMLQFDYNRFGLQGSNLRNQQNLYNYGEPTANQINDLDGSNHVWSVTLNPTFTLVGQGAVGAYAVVGGGFYHKVTDFTVPTTGTYCDYYYGCYEYQANQIVDDYTSNAGGVNAGLGLTYKLSRFSNQRLYVEGRYVVVFNQQRVGLTAFNVNSTFAANYTGYNFYPANSNRTAYIPITVGIRF